MKEFIVYENKFKVLRILGLEFIMLVASAFVLYLGYKSSSLSLRAIGSAGVIFFGYATVFLLKRTIIAFRFPEKAVIVKVNHQGVFDFSSKSSKGLITWEEMSSVKVTRWFTMQNIIIELKPKSKFRSKVKKNQINIETSDVLLQDLLLVIEKGLKRSK